MLSRNQQVKLLALAALLAFAAASAACGGSRAKANSNQNSPGAGATPEAVQVTTAATIVRDLPRFIEATGSL
ncbi:MAG TPA: hypothetical protein VGV38_09865, partial [Pyrinomonadaceae bacterium]|nr:hypothetical protein [Pyrinomonadaceae bacterium]